MSLDFNRLCLRCMSPAVSQGYCLNCGAPVGFAQEPAFALTPGSILDGRYLVGGVLGHGGFGITYLGLDLKHETRVAIKEFMPADAAGRAPGQLKVTARKGEDFQYGLSRFFDEARTIYRYRNHANIVHIYKLFRENGTAYYVMEYLRRYLKIRGGRLGFQELMTIVLPVMDALEYVHGDHVIHRDVSPDNIYLGDTVKLIDFGAARTAFAGQSKSFSIILKRGFAPEEQYRSHGRQGPWTDIYALAGTMYMALSGTMVPEAPERLVSDRLEDIRTLVPELPAQAGSALMTALAVRAESRYQRVTDFRGALLGKSEKTQWGDDPQSAFRRILCGGKPHLPGDPVGGAGSPDLPAGLSPDGQRGQSAPPEAVLRRRQKSDDFGGSALLLRNLGQRPADSGRRTCVFKVGGQIFLWGTGNF